MRRFRRRLNIKIKFKIFLILLILILIVIDIRLRPVIKSIIEDRAKAVAVTAINNAINRELGESDFKYSDIARIERSEEGKLLGITTNIQKINCLKSNISSAILEEISNMRMRKIGVPLGAIFGNEFLSGAGPIIPIKIFVTGNVSSEFESEFSEAGINQTKHLINLNTSVNVSAIIPGYPVQTSAKTNVTIAETIIVGEVPRVYAASEPTKRIREAKALEGMSQ
ncbi:MAG: sporulation protein YunB [Oscillospiraceae bacterium]|jgi:sporulation protein YunB|nr:sporulation protein YunB [Oscillospiraceae bacterium]